MTRKMAYRWLLQEEYEPGEHQMPPVMLRPA